jgi:hypothetical protein
LVELGENVRGDARGEERKEAERVEWRTGDPTVLSQPQGQFRSYSHTPALSYRSRMDASFHHPWEALSEAWEVTGVLL